MASYIREALDKLNEKKACKSCRASKKEAFDFDEPEELEVGELSEERLEEIINNICAWAAEHDDEFIGVFIDASGMDEEELKHFDLMGLEDLEDEDDEEEIDIEGEFDDDDLFEKKEKECKGEECKEEIKEEEKPCEKCGKSPCECPEGEHCEDGECKKDLKEEGEEEEVPAEENHEEESHEEESEEETLEGGVIIKDGIATFPETFDTKIKMKGSEEDLIGIPAKLLQNKGLKEVHLENSPVVAFDYKAFDGNPDVKIFIKKGMKPKVYAPDIEFIKAHVEAI